MVAMAIPVVITTIATYFDTGYLLHKVPSVRQKYRRWAWDRAGGHKYRGLGYKHKIQGGWGTKNMITISCLFFNNTIPSTMLAMREPYKVCVMRYGKTARPLQHGTLTARNIMCRGRGMLKLRE